MKEIFVIFRIIDEQFFLLALWTLSSYCFLASMVSDDKSQLYGELISMKSHLYFQILYLSVWFGNLIEMCLNFFKSILFENSLSFLDVQIVFLKFKMFLTIIYSYILSAPFSSLLGLLLCISWYTKWYPTSVWGSLLHFLHSYFLSVLRFDNLNWSLFKFANCFFSILESSIKPCK